ncbi:MAG: aldo/keto reductase [Spirochaetaceae bacterium]|jgi:aryl-alcohol dehydrogenase-like predicted oxidoreductase|nr:aldo/keto reductase [Spirochaetaceae bacterium]
MKIQLGRTGLFVNRDGLGALPIQRASMAEAERILNKALDGGIDFFDTARAYSDSEEKIGKSIASRRASFVLATKTGARTAEDFFHDLETSLSLLHTDYIDIYQFHNPNYVPLPDDGTFMYEAMLQARAQGKIRFISITNHRLHLARQAVESALYDTVQFPLNYLSSAQEIDFARFCADKSIAFIAMKALSGGLITDIGTARTFLAQIPGVVPIWGIQRESELDALFKAQQAGDTVTAEQQGRIDHDRAELSGVFCRGCGYCAPCPSGIVINMCARMSLLLRRAPSQNFLGQTWRAEMEKIPNCKHCNICKSRCPYNLDIPSLLQANYQDYKQFSELLF